MSIYSYTHEDIRKFESNNPLEARIGKQNVHANKVHSGMERQKKIYPSLQIVWPMHWMSSTIALEAYYFYD